MFLTPRDSDFLELGWSLTKIYLRCWPDQTRLVFVPVREPVQIFSIFLKIYSKKNLENHAKKYSSNFVTEVLSVLLLSLTQLKLFLSKVREILYLKMKILCFTFWILWYLRRRIVQIVGTVNIQFRFDFPVKNRLWLIITFYNIFWFGAWRARWAWFGARFFKKW